METREKINHSANTQLSVPSWLLQSGQDGSSVIHASGTSFLVRTLHHFSEIFENEFYCERYAAKPLFLQCLDPGVKILALLAFIIFSAFASSLAVLAALAMIALVYAKLSGLAVGDYLRRVWAYLPVLIFVFSLPGASSLFTAGYPLFYVIPPAWFGLPAGLYFTAPGLETAARLALRCGISLSFSFLLLLTTRWSLLTAALARMHVPSIIVSILNMAYRYLFIMAETANGMMEARFLRTVGKLPAKDNRRFMSRSAAHLFIKSHFLSEEIYDAMICRGFNGKFAIFDRPRIKASDLLFIVHSLIILLVLTVGEKLF